ncbi:MAG: SRPBCC family protein [Acidimicrobiia bacterium]|nr:SRPBCC family protein [Acidimicrobiia bacterium]
MQALVGGHRGLRRRRARRDPRRPTRPGLPRWCRSSSSRSGSPVFLCGLRVGRSRRSRTDAIGIGGLFFLQGTAPRRVQVRLLVPLGVQVVVALVAASVRIYTPLAFGLLVPVLGLGLAGLWERRHGTLRTPRLTGPDPRGGWALRCRWTRMPPMADQATEYETIAAAPEDVYATLVDFERYPEFFRDIKETTVETVDDEGRPLEVTYRTAAMGRSTRYTLRYDYTDAPRVLRWELIKGDIMRRLDGHYRLEPVDTDHSATEVEYSLLVDLVVPLPAFVKRRAEARIIKAALPELKARLEATR